MRLAELLGQWVERGVTPGAVLLYGDEGRDVDTITAGLTHTHPRPGPAVTTATNYDLASVTKVVATTAVAMKLVEVGAIELDARAQRWIPELRGAGSSAITLRDLLGHASGLPAHVEFFKPLLAGERMGADSAREALLCMAAGTELECAPGERVIYSDLGFIILGFCLERATGQRLDRLTEELVTAPLAMTTTRYIDLEAAPEVARPHPVAPTEICPYRGLVVGEVHDDNAHAAGGICGHAGLFATAADLGRFARAMVTAAAGAADSWFAPEVVREFFTTAVVAGSSRRLGWDSPSEPPVITHAGQLWPRDGVGHTGFTGTSLWLDPARGRYVVLLTNRVHPGRDQSGIREMRCSLMDAVVLRLELAS